MNPSSGICICLIAATFGPRSVSGEGEMRLPHSLQPQSYNIQLLPIIEEGNFTTNGNIEILVDCAQNTNDIILNSADITIDKSSIKVRLF